MGPLILQNPAECASLRKPALSRAGRRQGLHARRRCAVSCTFGPMLHSDLVPSEVSYGGGGAPLGYTAVQGVTLTLAVDWYSRGGRMQYPL